MKKRRQQESRIRRYKDEVRRMIEASLSVTPPFTNRVRVAGKLSSFCDGLFHENYQFYIDDKGIAEELTEAPMMARMLAQQYPWQCDGAAIDRISREALTLQRLESSSYSMQTPKYISDLCEAEQMIGFVETFVPGVAMGKFAPVSAKTVANTIASAAAATHELHQQDFSHLPSFSNRSEHVVSLLNEIADETLKRFPVTLEAKSWIERNLPSASSACSVLHGDLLPQNLLAIFDFQSPTNMPHSSEAACLSPSQIGVVDWQAARIGSPAYDLAIVTRGQRKIAKGMGGRISLLNAYLNNGGQTVTENEVIIFELLLLMKWVQDAIRESDSSSPEHHAQMLAGFLKRLS